MRYLAGVGVSDVVEGRGRGVGRTSLPELFEGWCAHEPSTIENYDCEWCVLGSLEEAVDVPFCPECFGGGSLVRWVVVGGHDDDTPENSL